MNYLYVINYYHINYYLRDKRRCSTMHIRLGRVLVISKCLKAFVENISLFPSSRPVHIYCNTHVGGRHYPYWHCFLTRGPLLSTTSWLYRHDAHVPFLSFRKTPCPRQITFNVKNGSALDRSSTIAGRPSSPSLHNFLCEFIAEKSRRVNDQRNTCGFCESLVTLCCLALSK